ncbi:hypothetical protein LTR95_008389 [Oleoguttula sp. CCFEE 5521]
MSMRQARLMGYIGPACLAHNTSPFFWVMAQTSQSSPPVGEARGRYHHYIPRFILRNFAADDQPPPGPVKFDKKGKAKKNRDPYINVVNLTTGIPEQRLVSKQYGLTSMYCDENCGEPEEVEEQLSRLEGRAAQIIAKVKKLFAEEPDGVLTLTRSERNDLRRFLFVMKYRNSNFYQRYNHDTIEDYTTHDKERMRDYMMERGFRSPRDVWLDNLRAFMDIEMDMTLQWTRDIMQRAYGDDAKMFIAHAQHSFLAFCRPEDEDEEFLLTANAYGIFEGPSSSLIDADTGLTAGGIRTEWHNFAPVSPTLMIVLRSNFLPGGKTGTLGISLYQQLKNRHSHPDEAGSALQDLPVKCCTPVYIDSLGDRVNEISDPGDMSDKDTFEFHCFPLPSRHVSLINTVMLEETPQTEYFSFKTRSTAIKTLTTYLERDDGAFKKFSGEQDPRYAGFKRLNHALHRLGGSTTARCSVTRPLQTHMTEWVSMVVGMTIYEEKPRLRQRYEELSRSRVHSTEPDR